MVLEAVTGIALTGIILTEQKFISDCRYRVIESSSLVPVLFREVFSHPYISLFHLLVNGFSVTCVIIHLSIVGFVAVCLFVLFYFVDGSIEVKTLRNEVQ